MEDTGPSMESIHVHEYGFAAPRFFRCPSVIPRYLYRVQTPESQARFDFGDSLVTGFAWEGAYKGECLREILKGHLAWFRCQEWSPFISTLDDREHAENWARMRLHKNRNGSNVQLYRIDTTKLDPRSVCNARWLLLALGTSLDDDSVTWPTSDEYLIAQRVPAQAIELVHDFRNGDVEEPVQMQYINVMTLWRTTADQAVPAQGH